MMASVDDPPDMTTGTTGATNTPLTDETAAIVASFDPTVLIQFITDLAIIVLAATREDLQVSLLSYPDTLQRCSRFAADPTNHVLYLRKETGETTAQNGLNAPQIRGKMLILGVGGSQYVYYLSAEFSSGPTTVVSLSIMKRPLPLDPSIPLQSQLQIANLPGQPTRTGQEATFPFESIHTLVRHAISPYFDCFTRGETDQTVRRGKGMHDEAKTGRTGLKIALMNRDTFDEEEDCRA